MEEKNKYGIMRFEKLKELISVARVMKHIFREQDTPNAAPGLSNLNESLFKNGPNSTQTAVRRLKNRLGKMDKPPRKNAVLAVEAIFTASPEAMIELSVQERRAYFRDCVRWIAEMVGMENMVAGVIHRDEKTEHCHVVFTAIPKGENSLNCRKLIGGHKNRASELQDDFFNRVASKHGFARGRKGSRVSHQSLREYNKLVQNDLPSLRAEKKELEIQNQDLRNRIEQGKLVLKDLVQDIQRAIEEQKLKAKYCLDALQVRLKERWKMVYEGNNKFTSVAEEFVEQQIDKPTREIQRPTYRMR